MIRISKVNVATPAILAPGGKGDVETRELMQAATNGQTQVEFQDSIYGHKSVKEALIGLQKDKCCFCQGFVTDTSYGDVEHFRPKGGYQQSEQQSLQKPGYYWLAYDFSNLFFACQKCNEVYKRNYFPLADESKRALSHTNDCLLEDSLILHPELDNPEDHITFVDEVVKSRNQSVKGRETIKRTGLDREKLNDSRLEYLETLRVLAIIARSKAEEAYHAREHLKRLGQPGRLFSAMVRANFPDLV
ncbi:MAG: hypothetical protein EAZ91_07290 [Cytophagales bacterium]|nr:MAG: hypothetical protein EAZ91_07290 [Cytophagales bacterium]